MNRNHLIVYFSCISLFLVISCSKNPGDIVPDPPPVVHELSTFNVELIERKYARAIIRWSPAISTNTLDTVKYKVSLNNVVIDSNLSRLTDTLQGILFDNLYQGSVTAYTRSGLQRTQQFTLDRMEGTIFSADGDQLRTSRIFTNGVINPVIWSAQAGTYNGGTPTVWNDTLFFSNNNGTLGSISARSAQTGNVYWSISPGYSVVNESSITYDQGNLYASTDSGVVSLKANTGTLNWKYLRPNPSLTNLLMTNPVIDNNLLFVGTRGNTGALMALNVTTGAPVWEYPLSGQICLTPAVLGNMLIFNAGADVLAINKTSGLLVWKKAGWGKWPISPVLVDNKIIVAGDDGYVTALNPGTGDALWRKYFRGPNDYSSMATGNGMCFFSLPDGSGTNLAKLVALKAATGDLVWETTTLTPVALNIIYASNSIYACGYGPYASIMRYNALLGNVEAGHSVISQRFSLMVNNKMYYNADNGNYKQP